MHHCLATKVSFERTRINRTGHRSSLSTSTARPFHLASYLASSNIPTSWCKWTSSFTIVALDFSHLSFPCNLSHLWQRFENCNAKCQAEAPITGCVEHWCMYPAWKVTDGVQRTVITNVASTASLSPLWKPYQCNLRMLQWTWGAGSGFLGICLKMPVSDQNQHF